MIDLGVVDAIVWVEYSKDEAYRIRFITDEAVMLAGQRSSDKIDEIRSVDDAVRTSTKHIIVPALVENVLDWKGVFSNGKPLPCNMKNKTAVFTKFAVTRGQWLFNKCRDPNTFIQAEPGKNSEASSNTTSTTRSTAPNTGGRSGTNSLI